MHLSWRAAAQEDLRRIFDYIAERNPAAAEKLLVRIEFVAERLADHPFMHRPGRVPGTREAVAHPNYILVYKVGTDIVEILAVLHARQRYP